MDGVLTLPVASLVIWENQLTIWVSIPSSINIMLPNSYRGDKDPMQWSVWTCFTSDKALCSALDIIWRKLDIIKIYSQLDLDLNSGIIIP